MKTKMCVAMLAAALAATLPTPTRAAATGPQKPVIVLVHGAFADGSAWQAVIPRLQKAGYKAVAVQNTLVSFSADVATTRRVFEAQIGPVVAVGHSYGGAVITAAAAGSGNVKSLVYVAAFVPDAGEKIGELYQKLGKAPLLDALVPDSADFLAIDPARYREVFAADVAQPATAVMAATQKPIARVAFDGVVENAAWRTLPSWYLVATQDKALLPELQRFMAKRAGAKTTEVQASHVPFVSQPDAVARIILDAARSVVH